MRNSYLSSLTVLRVVLISGGLDPKKDSFDFDDEFQRSRRRKLKRKRRSCANTRDLDEGVNGNEITLPCPICKHEIDLPEIFFHRKLHDAMATLGVQWLGEKKPARSAIVAQRQVTITKLLTSLTYPEKTLGSIDHAFELLRKKHLPGYYKIINNIHQGDIYSKKLYHVLIKGIAVCRDRNSPWRAEMNDKFTIIRNFGNKPNICFFGLFAGHGGVSAVDLTSRELPLLFLHQLSISDPSYQMTPEERTIISSFHPVFGDDYTAVEHLFSTKKRVRAMGREYENIHKAFAKAFWRMDRLLRLGREEVSRVQWSGCSAVICMLESKSSGDKKNWRTFDPDSVGRSFPSQRTPSLVSGVLHIANTGNVEALLCRNGKSFYLTKEHTTKNRNERRRVLQKGAIISSNEPHGLLEGKTSVTRGLGFHGNLKLKKFIIPAPQTISIPINNLCQFLILATSGLWEVLNMKEVTTLAIRAFQVHKERYHSTIPSKSSLSKGPLSTTINEARIDESGSNICILFQSKSKFAQDMSTVNSEEILPVSKCSLLFTSNAKSLETVLPEKPDHEPHKKGTQGSISGDSVPTDLRRKKKVAQRKNFYEGAAEHISQVLVNAAFAAGSRNNITVMVILFKGSEYLFLA